ncbi:MAG: sigma-70 family RNA polymerase sigma factor [Bacteroidales bacterium]|nr:sigma-70 family RNA polymerase sigma factor [Bacteroidales bacterium]HOF81352.1 sigma-70 family RNA polymerase sigma factor [Bacteroidales bacterium]HOR76591.1 sigma-70 family RNA polymerase sigma factor [Bacteroidales bacterium]HPL11986.1 sigma-70 family RNA polymerase sigma factor [Bacteroidales bacterium]
MDRFVFDYSSIEDFQLIDKAISGDDNAFAELVKRYQQAIAKIVISMLGPGEDAQDVGQQVFIRFFRALEDFRGESTVLTYLTRIAINLSLNELNRRKRFFTLFSKATEIAKENYTMADETNIEYDFEIKELINNALQSLQPKYRSVIVLRMMEGYTTKETAKILNLPIGTVLSRLSRAQDKLKEILEPIIK